VGGPLTILDQNFASSSCDPMPSFAPFFSPYTYDLVNLEDVMNCPIDHEDVMSDHVDHEDVMNENDPFLKPFCPLSNPNH
jgi:hypothetical protein